MPSEHFQPGQIIFKEGEKSHDAYYLVQGEVEISVFGPHGKQTLAKIGPGEIFGEMGMIMDRPRSATATALDSVLVETITESEFESYFLQNPDRLHTYLSTLFERIRKTDLLLQISGAATPPAPKAPPAHEPVYRVRIRSLYDQTAYDHREVNATITKLPYRIGRSHFDTAVSSLARNELSIDDVAPYHLSRNHCEIDFENGHFILRDRGSKLGSYVNGEHISVDSGKIAATLQNGTNTIILGNEHSPHRFELSIEVLS